MGWPVRPLQGKNQRQAARRAVHSGSERTARANKKYSLKQNYGLTLEQFEAMPTAQGNRCAICNQPLGGTAKSVHVDHDHTTRRVRGLLRNNGNNGLGRFRDDPAVLRHAALYVITAQAVALPEGDRPGQLCAGDARQLDLLADCHWPMVRIRPGTGARDVPAGLGV